MTTLPEPEVNAVVKLVDRLTKERDEARTKAQVETDFSDMMRMERDAARDDCDALTTALEGRNRLVDECGRVLDKHGVGQGALSLRVSKLACALEDARAEALQMREERNAASGEFRAMRDQRDSARAEVAKLKSDLAARPVVESVEARDLRELLRTHDYRWDSIKAWPHGALLVGRLEAFANSAPPVALPVRDVVVESDKVRALREAWNAVSNVQRASIADCWCDGGTAVIGAALRALCESAPPVAAPAPSENARVLGLMDRNDRLREERDSLRAELAALKSAPRHSSAVDRELREALEATADEGPDSYASYWTRPIGGEGNRRVGRALKSWLSAPRSPDGEYVEAGMAYAEAMANDEATKFIEAWNTWKALYDARKRGGAATVDVAPDSGVVMSESGVWALEKGREPRRVDSASTRSPLDLAARELAEADVAYWKSTPEGKPFAPSMADRSLYANYARAHNAYLALRNAGGEKNAATPTQETVYVAVFNAGDCSWPVTEAERGNYVPPSPVSHWLAIDARRVDEKGGAS
jgi:hypothetical protein